MKQKLNVKGLLWHLAILGILSFIFGNSLLPPQQSYSSSAVVTELLNPSQGGMAEMLERVLRKVAHLVEFASLGVVTIMIKNFYVKSKSIWFFLFFVLQVAVVDEWLQVFSGRTSSVSDVLLDFLGALMGMAVAVAATKLAQHYRKRRNCK